MVSRKMGAIRRFRPAAERLIHFAQSPLGEEVVEGVTAGGLAGLALLSTGQPIEQTALQTALAMAGGIGVGMGGRRIGAALGKRIHPAAYKDQAGMLASISRASGQEGIFTGMKDSMGQAAQSMRKNIRNGTITDIEFKFAQNPTEVAKQFGMSVDELEKVLPLLRKADDVVTPEVAKSIDNMADGMNARAKSKQGSDSEVQELVGDLNALGAGILNHQPTVITGEHTGRMLGRAWGDELGVVGGLATGTALGNYLGLNIEEEEELI